METSRRDLMKIAGAGGSAGAVALFLAACGDSKKSGNTVTEKSAKGGAGDLKILNYALTLEYLESAFYADVAASGKFKGTQLDLIKRIGSTEQQHVAALTEAIKQLGGKPVAAPKTKFPLDGTPKEILTVAAAVENLGAAAYLGQATKISSPQVLASALAIHSVEGRHAAALNFLLGKDPTPDGAFAKPASMAEVLPKVKPFITS
jgi:rubrerythrin